MMRSVRGAVALALLVLPLAVSGPPPAVAQTESQATVEATLGPDGVQRVEIIGGGYFFRPARIAVKVGVPVELTARKEPGMAPHDIVVRAPEAGIAFAVDLRVEPRTITFTPTKAGVYPMYCSKRFLFFASHRDRGMEGVIEVRE